jgi:hypothetical protein
MSLHLGHPLVIAALEETRAEAQARRFTLRVRARSPEAAKHRGRRGRARVFRVVYRGFEVTERLVPLVILDPAEGPLSMELARDLFAGPISEEATSLDVSHVPDDVLDDARDELMFLETEVVGAGEQPRFERTIEQIERFMADRILLLGQQRDAALARLAKAEADREAAVGPEPRGRAEIALRRAQVEIDQLEAEITRLRAGDDDNYRRWRTHTQERRYARPEFQQIFDAEIEIV